MVHVYRIAHRSVSCDALEGCHKFGQNEERLCQFSSLRRICARSCLPV